MITFVVFGECVYSWDKEIMLVGPKCSHASSHAREILTLG